MHPPEENCLAPAAHPVCTVPPRHPAAAAPTKGTKGPAFRSDAHRHPDLHNLLLAAPPPLHPTLHSPHTAAAHRHPDLHRLLLAAAPPLHLLVALAVRGGQVQAR